MLAENAPGARELVASPAESLGLALGAVGFDLGPIVVEVLLAE